MKQTYTFSYYIKQRIPYLKRRKWWDIFGADTLAYRETWLRKGYAISDPALLKLIKEMAGKGYATDLSKLIFDTDNEIANLQLEENEKATQYVQVISDREL